MLSSSRIGRLCSLLVLLQLLPGCNAVNPFCGSSRPAPVLSSISPATQVFAQMPPSFVLTLTGSSFVSSSLVVFNGSTLAPAVNSSSQLTVTITASMITGPGSYNIVVQTPSGTTGDLGCSSGGQSHTFTLTVT